MIGPRETLHELEKAPPGQRFQRLYRRRQQGPHGKLLSLVFNVGGPLIIAAGVASYAIPMIPSEPVILLGIAVLAQGTLRGAKIMDGAEVRLRRWLAPVLKLWRGWPKWLRMALAVVWMFTAAGLSYWGYRVITD
jgi:hypothetical protein